MKKITCLLSILFIIVCLFAGCKKQQAPLIKSSASKVQSVEIKKEQEEAKKVELEVYMYDPKGRRDPFLSLIAPTRQKSLKVQGGSHFESYGIDEINLLGIAWDKQKYYALIMLPH